MTGSRSPESRQPPLERRRVLVTGAAGRIGSHVVRELTERGHQVTGLDARPPSDPVDGVRYVVARLEDLDAQTAEFADIDTVVHLAALMSWADGDAAAMMQANVLGTFRLVEATARRGSLRRFVFASSGEVYPEMAPKYLPLDEHHPLEPTSFYGATKLLGEDLLRFYARSIGLPLTVLRFSHVQDPAELLDPDSFFSGPRFFVRPRLARERLGNNRAVIETLAAHDGPTDTLIAATREDGSPVRMTILAAPDMARAVRMAAESPAAEGQTLGIGPDDPVDLADLARQFADRTGLPVVELTVPNSAANYWTVNARAREVLGFRPRIDYAQFIDLAVAAWRVRQPAAV